jgi:tRNA(Ile)-lysidine synthase
VHQQFLNHIYHHSLCKTTDKILLAISGGVDSMVMLDLFIQAGFTIGVAHCNFGLRGEEAKKDELLVQSTCQQNNIPFYVRRFETAQHAKEQGISIQMAARELRYDFFQTIVSQHHYDFVATAHQLNDVLETVLLNLARGTGMDGLTGVPVKNGNIIRPILFASRKMIAEHAAQQSISWRDDVSNNADDYHRNFIRNRVVTLLHEINPNLENTFSQTLARIKGSVAFAKKYIDEFRNHAVVLQDDEIRIQKPSLLQEPSPEVLLWELIKDFKFNFSQCIEIIERTSSGKRFLTSDFELIVDRELLIIHPLHKRMVVDLLIDQHQTQVERDDEQLFLSRVSPSVQQVKDEGEALLDVRRLTFPLTWRRWRNGDSFKPLGMTGEKKVSDFLIDKKVPVHEKEKVTVIESNGEIVWLVGYRINDDYKITEATTDVLRIKREKTTGKKIS